MTATPNEFVVSCDALGCKSFHYVPANTTEEAFADIVSTYGWTVNDPWAYCTLHLDIAA